MRHLIIIIIIFCLASIVLAIDGDVNNDAVVDACDVSIFVSYWLDSPVADPNCDLDEDGSVNFIDFAMMAQNYTGGLIHANTVPTANDVNVSIYTYAIEPITLVGSDDGHPLSPGRIEYIITTLPADGNLQDPASGSGYITSVPHTLNNGGNIVWYSTDSNGVETIDYKVTDGQYDSNTATVTIDVNDHPTTQLSFNKSGYVTIPDDPNLEFVDGRIISFFLKTREPFAMIMSKREPDAQGYTISLVSGKPNLSLYDANGTEVFSFRSPYRIDNGLWEQVSIMSPNDANYMYIEIEGVDVHTNGYYQTPSDSNITNFVFENDANLVIGPNYKWQMDNLRFYNNYIESEVLLGPVFEGASRQGTDAAGEGGFLMREADIRWLCDEGSGSTITDDKDGGIVGTISDPNDVKFMPHHYMYNDTSVQQYYRSNR